MPTPKAGYEIDGEKVPSVTTIVGRYKESGALIGWAWKQGYGQGKRGEKMDRNKATREAADIGSHAHALVEAHLKGLPQPETPENFTEPMYDAAMSAFDAYLTWEKQTRMKIISLEAPMVSIAHRFGGTPDAIALLDDVPGLLDFKTSNAVYTDFLYQISAYKNLHEEVHPDMLLSAGMHLLKFGKDHGDFTHHFFGNLEEAWRGFLLMRDLYEIDYQLKKRVK